MKKDIKKLKLMSVLGTRPEIIRLSEILKECDRHFDHIFVHTGQNYDYELNEVFFNDLGLRKPDYFLGAVGETAIQTVGNILVEVEKLIIKEKPDAFMVLGDTNSALSVYVAKRYKVPVFHLEAGNRSYEERVPEEINRRIVDHISDINMVYSDHSREHLVREGLPSQRIIKTGSPIFEVLNVNMPKIIKSKILTKLKLKKDDYFLVSFHREENVDSPENLEKIVGVLNSIVETYKKPIIVSTHPRTKKRLDEANFSLPKSVHFLKPFGFFDFINLQINAFCTISDSGTINEESSMLNLPAINMRIAHERPEATDEGVTVMTGLDKDRIIQAIEMTRSQMIGNKRVFNIVRDYSMLNVSKKVVRTILSYQDFIDRKVWFKNK